MDIKFDSYKGYLYTFNAWGIYKCLDTGLCFDSYDMLLEHIDSLV